MDEMTLRALADAPVNERRRRRRARTVWLSALLIVVAAALAISLALLGADAAIIVMLTALLGPPVVLGMLLASERVLTDWLLPEDHREGRAYLLNPIAAFAESGRAPWVTWWSIMLTFWVAGGAVVDSVAGALVGLGVGLVMSAGLLLLGVLIGWLVLVPVGLLLVIAARRDRSVQAVRLALLAAVLLGMVLLATPIAWTDLGALPGWEGIVRYLKAVAGDPEQERLPPGVLWTARAGLAVMMAALLPLVVLLRQLPQQQAAGRLYQRALRRDRFAP